MRKKLTTGIAVAVIFLMAIVIGNQAIIKLFGDFSEKLIVEYHELHVLQDFKVSLSKVIFYSEHTLNTQNSQTTNELINAIQEVQTDYQLCAIKLTEEHKDDLWSDITVLIKKLDNANEKLKIGDISQQFSDFQNIQVLAIITFDKVNEIIDETLNEIVVYEQRNQTVIQHGTISIVFFSMVLILILAIGGYLFIRNLTTPIDELVNTTQQIISGDNNVRVKVRSNDEFLFLANSFNSMLDSLNKTMISIDYMDNILNNLQGILLVTDQKCQIQFANATSESLLKYDRTEIVGRHLNMIIPCVDMKYSCTIENCSSLLNNLKEITNKKGKKIPVQITTTVLRNKTEQIEGMIIAAQDITLKKAQEKKIEKIRKGHIIALNEAQEKERIRFATDIHDGLGQMLTGISYALNDIEPETVINLDTINSIHKRVDVAIAEARSIALNITPIALKDFGLIVAIDNLVQRYNQLKGTKIIFNEYGFNSRLDPKLEKTLYRICQEALNNIKKHANANNASVELFQNPDSIIMVIEDDGIGFETNNSNNIISGIGLISMRDRAFAFDGEITINSKLNQGTEIIVEIPNSVN